MKIKGVITAEGDVRIPHGATEVIGTSPLFSTGVVALMVDAFDQPLSDVPAHEFGRSHTSGCMNTLVGITVPPIFNILGESTFKDMDTLRVVALPGVSLVCEGALYGTRTLDFVVFSSAIRTLGVNAFMWSGIRSIEALEGLLRIGECCFWGSRLASIELPSTLVSIGLGAFAHTYLKSLTIPASVNVVGAKVCLKCDELESVTIHAPIRILLSQTFCGCSKLREIILPPTLICIMWNVFGYCASLESISLPEGLLHIGSTVFERTRITHLVVPRTVTFIHEHAFNGMPCLERVVLPSRFKGARFYNLGEVKYVYRDDDDTDVPRETGRHCSHC